VVDLLIYGNDYFSLPLTFFSDSCCLEDLCWSKLPKCSTQIFIEETAVVFSKADFTRQTKVDELALANSSWCVWTAQIQSANTLANCWRQIELASILADYFTNFFVLVNSYRTCERLANMCCWLSTNQNTGSIHVIYLRDTSQNGGRNSRWTWGHFWIYRRGSQLSGCKAAFTRQTKVGKLVLANWSWCVWTAQIQSVNTLANCWRQVELASILANFFTNCFVLVNSFLTCERLADMCC